MWEQLTLPQVICEARCGRMLTWVLKIYLYERKQENHKLAKVLYGNILRHVEQKRIPN